MTRVDVYPVGILAKLRQFWRAHVTLRTELPPVARRHSRRDLWRSLKVNVWRNIRYGNWHQLKTTFNGYLAEPTPWPEHMRRCGSGWTKRRALKSLERHGYPQA